MQDELNELSALNRVGANRLTVLDAQILLHLYERSDESMIIKQIADDLKVAYHKVARACHRLEESGAIARDDPNRRRRSVFVKITDDGKKMIRIMTDVFCKGRAA